MANVLHGDAGGNQLNAAENRTQVYGLQGNDTLTADGKNEVLLVGGSGNDSLIMMGGNGTLAGGEGADTFELTYSATKKLSAVIEDLVPSDDKIIVHFDGDTAPQITSSVSGNDVVLRDGERLNVTLKGIRENDYYDGSVSFEIESVLRLTNAKREKENLPSLTLSDGLMAGAEIRVQEITELGAKDQLDVYRHTRPDGTLYDTVFDEVGKHYASFAENLDGGAESPAQVVEQWMSSASHKKNILDATYKKLGISYEEDDSDPTDHRWYWTQLFGDSLISSERATVGTAVLLNANMLVDTISNLFVPLSDNPDTFSNTAYGATIDALGGADSVSNTSVIVSISGGNDNDTITNSGTFVTICAGKGNDSVRLSGDAQENVIEYASGDGNDTISGFNSTDTLKITSDEFTPVTVGNDVIVKVGTDSIKLLDGTRSFLNIDSTNNKVIIGTETNDFIANAGVSVSIDSGLGNDTIANWGSDMTLNGNAGADYIYNDGASAKIYGGTSNDSVSNHGSLVTIDSGDDNDYVYSNGSSVSIDSGAGDDSVSNVESNVTIGGGDGSDSIYNEGSSVNIDGGAGDDNIGNFNSNVTISAGDGSDTVNNNEGGTNVTINVGDGNDSVHNVGTSVTIDSGAGDDNIDNFNSNVTIGGGAGDDTVYNNRGGSSVSVDGGTGDDNIGNFETFVTVSGGDGNDYIFNNNGGSSVNIDGGAGNDTLYNSYNNNNVSLNGGAGNDSIVNVSSGATITSGSGNDTVYLANDSQNNLIQYASGDGADIIRNFKANDTISISGGEYTPMTLGSNVVLEVAEGTDYILLSDAASLGSSLNINGRISNKSKLITLTENPDNYENTVGTGATIEALGGNDSITNTSSFVTINGGADNDAINNKGDLVSINGGDGNDFILNDGGSSVTVDGGAGSNFIGNNGTYALVLGGAGNDTIGNFGSGAVINAKAGDDQISFAGNSLYNYILYEAGDGNDIVLGLNETDTLVIADSEYTSETVGNDILLAVGTNTITLWSAASLSAVHIYTAQSGGDSENKLITVTDNSDVFNNTLDGATISVAGNDRYGIINYGANVSIKGGTGSDTIYNNGVNTTVDGGAGDDDLGNWTAEVTINGGDGNDYIFSNGSSVSIDGGTGADSISNWGLYVTISSGDGNDTITNNTGGNFINIDSGAGDDSIRNLDTNVTISSGDGNDSIINNRDCSSVSIDGGSGNDFVFNGEGDKDVTINGGAGDDTVSNVESDVTIGGGSGSDSIYNEGSSVNIDGGASNDYIRNFGSNVTISAGKGDDYVSLSDDATNNLINYTTGDGNDTILGYSANTTLNISGDTYTTQPRGDDIIYIVGNGSITLKDARDKPLPIIIGESGTSGGGSDSGGDGGGSSSGSGDGGRGGNDGGNVSGGTSANEGRTSDASGGRSAVGSRGRSSSTSTDNGGNNVRVTTTSSSSRGGGSRIATGGSTVDLTGNWATSTEQTATAQRVYAGGNQVVGDYVSGEKIVFGDVYTGSFYDGAGNFFIGSSTGALVIQNAADKVVDLSDAAGNSFIKAYSATTAGVIDGRGLTGFEIINGSAGSDAIFAGDGGSQLWGGLDVAADTMIGGGGADIFIGGRTQGADFILNASATDIVHLNDATLSDIIATEENNGAIAVAFNTGNVVAVQSSEALSAAFMLADGSAYRYNHVNKSWQTA